MRCCPGEDGLESDVVVAVGYPSAFGRAGSERRSQGWRTEWVNPIGYRPTIERRTTDKARGLRFATGVIISSLVAVTQRRQADMCKSGKGGNAGIDTRDRFTTSFFFVLRLCRAHGRGPSGTMVNCISVPDLGWGA